MRFVLAASALATIMFGGSSCRAASSSSSFLATGRHIVRVSSLSETKKAAASFSSSSSSPSLSSSFRRCAFVPLLSWSSSDDASVRRLCAPSSARISTSMVTVSLAKTPTTTMATTAESSLLRSHYRRYSSSSILSMTTTTTTTTAAAADDDDAKGGKEGAKERPFVTWTYDEPCRSMDWTDVHPSSVVVVPDLDLDGSDLVIVGVFAPAKDTKGEGDENGDDDEGEGEEEEKEVPEPVLTGKAKELDDALGGALTELMVENAKEFKSGAKAGSATPTLRIASSSSEGGGGKTKKYILLGMGTVDKNIEDGTMAKIGTVIASKCHKEKKVSKCSVLLPEKTFATTDGDGDENGGASSSSSSMEAALIDISAAFYSALYSDNRYRTGSKAKKAAEDLETVVLVPEGFGGDGDENAAAMATQAVEAGRALASGVHLTKDIVNAPHNVLNSLSLADTARRIADASPGEVLTCEVLNKDECEKRGMGAFLGVARGSETEPQFIHLTYKPKEGKIAKKVAVIGKGLLFDTGGYNIKTSMMELMKFDCGGAAAVLGAARAVASLAPEGVEAHFIVAACENMINQKAVVPSDVLTASNGKTIEVIDTDAEGRLTLADAMVFADKEIGCESIVELSTLTGACMVALGKGMAGVWTSDDGLAKEIEDVSKSTGDKTWRMPLAKEYNEQLESKIADIKNCGTRYGGAITAALFLENFVSKKKPFAHIDIAGPVWSDKTGATGFGAKLVTEWIKRQGQKSD